MKVFEANKNKSTSSAHAWLCLVCLSCDCCYVGRQKQETQRMGEKIAYYISYCDCDNFYEWAVDADIIKIGLIFLHIIIIIHRFSGDRRICIFMQMGINTITTRRILVSWRYMTNNCNRTLLCVVMSYKHVLVLLHVISCCMFSETINAKLSTQLYSERINFIKKIYGVFWSYKLLVFRYEGLNMLYKLHKYNDFLCRN